MDRRARKFALRVGGCASALYGAVNLGIHGIDWLSRWQTALTLPTYFQFLSHPLAGMVAILAAPFLLYFAVKHNVDGSSPKTVLFDEHHNVINAKSSGWPRSFVTRWLAVPLALGIAMAIILVLSLHSRPTGKLLVVVADFDYFYTSRHYGLTHKIVERLRAATAADNDIEIRALGKPVPWQKGSDGARLEGAKSNAAIVIWGDYKVPKDIASFNGHFEILIKAPRSGSTNSEDDLLPPSLVGEPTAPISDLESFTIQEQLSGQMVYSTLMVSGLARFEVGDWSHAVSRLSKAIEAPAPKEMIGSEVIYLYRGTAYGMLGHDAEAEADLSKSIEINPRLRVAFDNRGYVRGFIREKPDVDSAISDFTQAIELNSCDEKALANRGLLFRRVGKIVAAIHDYDLAIQCDPKNYVPFVLRGVARSLSGELPQAFEDYNRALELNPSCVEAFDDRGNAFYNTGDTDRAIADYTRAIRLDPRRFAAFLNRGNAWCRKGKPERGVQDYSKVVTLRPAWATAFFSRGNGYQQMHLFDLAIADYSKAIELDSGFLLAYKGRIVARLMKGEYRGALADLSHICLADTDAGERKFACDWLKYGEAVMQRWGGTASPRAGGLPP
jgi:tetratricopeptide (TPR) repeat protein